MTLNSIESDWYQDLITSKAKFDIGSAEAPRALLQEHFKKHLFFVTAHLKPITSKSETKKQEAMSSAFKAYYIELCSFLVGNDYNKKPKFQPFFIMDYDVEGSRSGKISNDTLIPHMHGLALIHPRNMEKFQNELCNGSNQIKRSQDGRIENVKYQVYEGNNDGIERMANYVTKYSSRLTDNQTNFASRLILPDLQADKYAFYKFYRDEKI